MQDVAHAAGLRRPTKTARLRDPSSRLRLARGYTPPRTGSAPLEGQPPPRTGSAPFEGRPFPRAVPPRSRARSPSSGPRLARGFAPPSAGARHAHGRPARVRRPRTWAFNALTPQDGAIMRPGLTPRCRRTNSPGRSPSPPLWGGLCGTAGVSPMTPRARHCTANALDPRKGAGRTLDSTFP
jgi:hypothetical protein